jgi:hypothetical protein
MRSAARNKLESARVAVDRVVSLFGGRMRLVFAANARNFAYNPETPSVSFRFRGCRIANKVYVIGPDKNGLYMLQFWMLRPDTGGRYVDEIRSIPNGSVAQKFSDFTGIRLP